jgi:hypothetical protein
MWCSIWRKSYSLADKATHAINVPQMSLMLWGWVKVYSNGSCQVNGRIDCGGVIRGSGDEWLGGFSKHIESGTTYIAELWEFWRVSSMWKDWILAKWNCVLIVRHITSNECSSSMKLSLVKHIWRLIDLESGKLWFIILLQMSWRICDILIFK